MVFVPFSLHDFFEVCKVFIKLYLYACNLTPDSFLVFLENMEDLCTKNEAAISKSKAVMESDKLPLFCECLSVLYFVKHIQMCLLIINSKLARRIYYKFWVVVKCKVGQAPNKNKRGRQKALEGVKAKLCWLLDSTNSLRVTVLFFHLLSCPVEPHVLTSNTGWNILLRVMSGALPEESNSLGLSMTDGE